MKIKRSIYSEYDNQYDQGYYNGYYAPDPVERQDFSNQVVTFGGTLTDFDRQDTDFGSVIENQVNALIGQQGNLLSPILQNPQSFVLLAFSSVLAISTLAIFIQNFLNPRQQLPPVPGTNFVSLLKIIKLTISFIKRAARQDGYSTKKNASDKC